MYDLIVFDWDGTLMDSEARIVACMQAAAEDVGLPVPGHDDTKEIIGLGLLEAIERLFPEASRSDQLKMQDCYRHHFLTEGKDPSPLFAGVREMLEELESADYLLAVATGKSRRGLDKVLEETDLKNRFHASRCADEAFSKPHPQMLLDIIDRLAVKPLRTLVVGDTEYDMQMAINAGASALGVSYGVHKPERLFKHGALDCLKSISDLPNWLSQTI